MDEFAQKYNHLNCRRGSDMLEDFTATIAMAQIVLITRLLQLVGSIGSSTPVSPHQLGGYRYPN